MQYTEWAAALDVSDFRIGYLTATTLDSIDEDDDDYTFKSESIRRLTEQSRDEIFTALCKGLGGKPGLFKSLWLSAYSEGDNRELEEDTFEEVTGEKMEVF